ncbi:MAG: hypothetical protein Q4A05_05500 [Ruminococcus sp.]|nr:hypothetical protein [Ruminococcus sp.]
MLSNFFSFKKPCLMTEAIITAIKYDNTVKLYELSMLGIGEDNLNYTNEGTAWLDEEDMTELKDSGELELPQQLVGARIKFVADNCEATTSNIKKVIWKNENCKTTGGK